MKLAFWSSTKRLMGTLISLYHVLADYSCPWYIAFHSAAKTLTGIPVSKKGYPARKLWSTRCYLTLLSTEPLLVRLPNQRVCPHQSSGHEQGLVLRYQQLFLQDLGSPTSVISLLKSDALRSRFFHKKGLVSPT